MQTITEFQTQILDDLDNIDKIILILKSTMLKIGHSGEFVDDFLEFLMVGIPANIFLKFTTEYCGNFKYHGYTEICLINFILDML